MRPSGELTHARQRVVGRDAFTRKRRRRKALVVEDCASTRLLLCYYLQKAGYVTTSTAAAETAIEKCKQQQYDLLLMDISLPGMNGADAIKKIRNAASAKTPSRIVVCSGYEADRIALSRDDCSFLRKPVSKHELHRHLRTPRPSRSGGVTADVDIPGSAVFATAGK